jgi:hypothetical protein
MEGQINVFYLELAALLRAPAFSAEVAAIKQEERELIAPSEQPVSEFATRFVAFMKEQ